MMLVFGVGGLLSYDSPIDTLHDDIFRTHLNRQVLIKLPVNLLQSPYTLIAAGTSLEQQRWVYVRAHTGIRSPTPLHTHRHPDATTTMNHNNRLYFPFSLLAPCRDPSLTHLHLNQLRPAWVLQHSPYTVRKHVRASDNKKSTNHHPLDWIDFRTPHNKQPLLKTTGRPQPGQVRQAQQGSAAPHHGARPPPRDRGADARGAGAVCMWVCGCIRHRADPSFLIQTGTFITHARATRLQTALEAYPGAAHFTEKMLPGLGANVVTRKSAEEGAFCWWW